MKEEGRLMIDIVTNVISKICWHAINFPFVVVAALSEEAIYQKLANLTYST